VIKSGDKNPPGMAMATLYFAADIQAYYLQRGMNRCCKWIAAAQNLVKVKGILN